MRAKSLLVGMVLVGALGGCASHPPLVNRQAIPIGMSWAELEDLRANAYLPVAFLSEDAGTITYRVWLESEGRDTPFRVTFEKGTTEADTRVVGVAVDTELIESMQINRRLDYIEMRANSRWWW